MQTQTALLLILELCVGVALIYFAYNSVLQYLDDKSNIFLITLSVCCLSGGLYWTYITLESDSEKVGSQSVGAGLTPEALQDVLNTLNDTLSKPTRKDLDDVFASFDNPNQTIMVTEEVEYMVKEQLQTIASKPKKIQLNIYIALLQNMKLNDSVLVKNIQLNQNKKIVYLELIEKHKAQ
ncbi:MAG: hypothetical protein EAZ57_03190 [Cytophagales bacterium]|nr:MAG: hypothetical protein EAZ67_03655 [Cytophagales bacterium]TAF61468.1 MAG: hypothetical protein EAZ57_03190 [Cytophagales bacterium]